MGIHNKVHGTLKTRKNNKNDPPIPTTNGPIGTPKIIAGLVQPLNTISLSKGTD